ncbi:ribonuclease E/G [Neofamilia massiliensis]|uniref:ribonuclease E/G n=1 Tax=Neofamilia massiliensis TaxID=1673724 RepID=UPI0006BB87D4|nr:ribonuclease E/G [Neofamilia massiliensis]
MINLTTFNFLEESEKYIFTGQVTENKLTKFQVFDKNIKSKVGNIYRARILNKVNGLDGFFVDIGEGKHGLLQVDEKRFSSLKETDEILVQVTYDGNEKKGPKLTEKYELKGKYFILTPFETGVSISKKIKDREKALKIKNYFTRNYKNTTFIIRTAAEERSIEDLELEFKKLFVIKEKLEKEKNFSPTPKLLYKNDYVLDSIDSDKKFIFITNSLIYSNKYQDKFFDVETIYDREFSIQKNIDVFMQIENLFKKRLVLDNGIELVFEKTEAFNVIDINSKGFFNPGKNLTKDANKNCAIEIINQIHLRNICGIILIDFISYSNKKNEDELLNYFYVESRKYNNPINVIGFTRLGILELTRNKAVNHLSIENLDLSIFQNYI